jgi:uncharacterized protein
VVRDPDEGVAADGTIVTGVGQAALQPAYVGLVRDVVATLRRAVGEPLHSVYLYGSVATGQARPPRSDLDVVAVLRSPAWQALGDVADELSGRHRQLVREIAIGGVLLETLAREDLVGAAERCFLRHYCLHVAGPDVREGYEPCRPSVELAVGFNGNLAAVLDDVRARLASEEGDRDELEARVCRKILMAAATLLSAREGGWSTDRGMAVELLARHAPHLEDVAAVALERSDPAAADATSAGRPPVTEFIDRLGGWLVAAYATARADARGRIGGGASGGAGG